MAYTPTEWKKGDVVTSDKLNKIEQGVASGGGVLVVGFDPQSGALDKTWQEIYDAPLAVIKTETEGMAQNYIVITTIADELSGYIVAALRAETGQDSVSWEAIGYLASTASDYPVAMG